MKFKIGDKVKIQIDPDDDKLSDLESDLLMDIAEGDIRGSVYDQIGDILERVAEGDSPVFTVTEAQPGWRDEPQYALDCNGVSMRYMWEERYLVSGEDNATTKTQDQENTEGAD